MFQNAPFPPSSPFIAAVSEPEPNHDVALSVYLSINQSIYLSNSRAHSLSLYLFMPLSRLPSLPSFLPSGMRCNYNSVPSTWNSIDQLIPITCGARSTQPSLARSVSLLVLNCAQVAVNQSHVPHLSKLETDHSAALPCPALNDPLPPLVCPNTRKVFHPGNTPQRRHRRRHLPRRIVQCSRNEMRLGPRWTD